MRVMTNSDRHSARRQYLVSSLPPGDEAGFHINIVSSQSVQRDLSDFAISCGFVVAVRKPRNSPNPYDRSPEVSFTNIRLRSQSHRNTRFARPGTLEDLLTAYVYMSSSYRNDASR